jgi:hypothetical protein
MYNLILHTKIWVFRNPLVRISINFIIIVILA